VEFTPHPRSLDGANAPTAAELTRLGFSDVNTALANTIEALENIPAKENPHKDLMKEIVGIREEISTMKEELRSEQQQIAKKAAERSTSTLNTQMTLLKRQLATTMQVLDMTRVVSSAIESNMDTTN
jgi:predicted  nucleic acid-binding Zn-ribbon protein